MVIFNRQKLQDFSLFTENTSKELKQETNLKGKKVMRGMPGGAQAQQLIFWETVQQQRKHSDTLHTHQLFPQHVLVLAQSLWGAPQGEAHHPGTALAWAGAKWSLSRAHLMGTLSEIGLVALTCPHASRV